MQRLIIAALVLLQTSLLSASGIIKNGGDHFDDRGEVINAHGAGFIKVGDYFYWIGENRKDGVFVSCYRSKDLVNWEFRGDLLTRESHPELANANIERPKVIYNDKTGNYVMWMHFEFRRDYTAARAAIAWSDDIEKPFNYVKSFRPFNNMSRDCTLYKEEDGTAYFMSTSKENYDLELYLLTDDYLDAKEHITTIWPGGHREAPTLIKHGEYYFLFTSGCTGWNPNQMKYGYAKSLRGPWSELINITDEISYDTQPTYIITVQGTKATSYLYLGDRWDPRNYFNSKYIFLPLRFSDATTPVIDWQDEVKVDVKTGIIQ
jgi:hypothetical protein